MKEITESELISSKMDIIDKIIEFHPSLGVKNGWSEYTGGMKDSGTWFYREMVDVSLNDLTKFLNEQST